MEWCTHKYNMNYGKVKEKISKANKGRVMSDETKRIFSQRSKMLRWVTNGDVERYINVCDVEKFIFSGWRKGRLPRKRGNKDKCLKK